MHATTPPIIYVLLFFFLLFRPVFPIKDDKIFRARYKSFKSSIESKKMKLINDHLKKINKPFLKSIKSPDGDIIDCVLIHHQPAFDHPKLKGTLQMGPPDIPIPNEDKQAERASELKQVWNANGESCPNGTIPIRRTTASDILASKSISYFGKKISPKSIAKHEHAIGYVEKGEYYGGQAIFNVWKPHVADENEFSLSQMWVIHHAPNRPSNTIEAGWMVYPNFYKDDSPRLFNYWTPDDYHTRCYNLLCPGFVQTNSKFALGAALDPISTYNGQQYDINIFIWKGPRDGNWWLRMGDNLMGYWPSSLFPDLCNNVTEIHYGGEVINNNGPIHTSTQMGSGHFPKEGFKKAAFVRNLEVVTSKNRIYPVSNLELVEDASGCYDVESGFRKNWGSYIFFGGPGNNPNCP